MARKNFLLILLLSGLLYSQQQIDIPWPTLANTDWPMIKHDPQFTGRSPFKGPQTPTVVWTRDMPYGIFSGPVIGNGGDLFFGSYYVFGDKFYSYDSDGNFIWEYSTGSGRATQSGILIDSSNTIYFGSRDSNFYALNPDGTFKWKYNTSGSILSNVLPNIDLQGNLYITNFSSAITDEGELYSIKPDGTLNWHVTYESGFAGKSPIFSPDGNTIYIAGFDSNLFALDLNGGIKWKFSCGNILIAPMIDSDGNIYFTPNNSPQYFYSLLANGDIRWRFFIQDIGPVDIYSVPSIDLNGNIYLIGYDTICCPYYQELISLSYSGNFKWKYTFEDIDDDFTQPLMCDSEGTVYVGSTNGSNYYAISSDGELKWKIKLNLPEQQVDNTGAIAKDGTLYLGVHDVSLFNGQTKTLIAIRDTGIVSVNNKESEITSYSLSQNYPNPFNPSTHIKYTIPQSGRVSLKVYDLLGKEVATLLDRHQNPGEYDVLFDATNLTSGIYFYQLQTGNFRATRKLILLK